MNLKLGRRYAAIAALVAVTLTLVLATPVAAGKTQLASRTAGAEVQSKSIDIVGANTLAINQFVKSTFHFKQGTVHAKHGDSIVLTNRTTETHTFSLVDGLLLPSTVGQVFNCGAPGTICAAVGAAHFPNGFNSPPVPCIDNGAPCVGPLTLDTPFKLTVAGDSVLSPSGGSPITMTVTANPGTVLHFMCVIHPWMQGALVVENGEGE